MDIYPGDLARLLYQEQLLKQKMEKCQRELSAGEELPYVAPTPGLISRIARWVRQRPQPDTQPAPRPRTI